MPLVVAATFGLLIGSFLNVVIYRVPLKRSIVAPRSACMTCGSQIRPWDNVPVLSWLLLRGRCRQCRSPISARYPLVEGATAVFFAVVAWRFWPTDFLVMDGVGITVIALTLAAFLYFAAISVALALIDLDTRTLPNSIVLPAYVVIAALLGSASLVTGDVSAIARAGIGAAALFVVYYVLSLTGGMGMGDVKLAGVIGILLGWLGWEALAVGVLASFILGGLFGVALLISRRATAKSGVPFGPWMLAGAWLGIFLGPAIAAGYLALFGLGES